MSQFNIDPILQVKNLHKRFALNPTLLGNAKNFIYAVNGVSFNLYPGKTTGLVGESGSGKSTVGKMICMLEEQNEGAISFRDTNINTYSSREKGSYHKAVQMIFQNPYTSLNPRQRIGSMLREIYRFHRLCPSKDIEKNIRQVLSTVGLSSEVLQRYPFEFSGGQRQRLCIARTLTVNPQIIVCDEPVSALDVSVQAQILRLLKDLQARYQLAFLFISHDLSVVYHTCDDLLIMYLGQIVEAGPIKTIFSKPAHPYTKALLSAIPIPSPQPKRQPIILQGEIPSPSQLPPGCPFYSRCNERLPQCKTMPPPRHTLSPAHQVSCWLYDEASSGKTKNTEC